jgi:hypothetical protein
MRIVLLPSPDGDTIAWEESYGQREGRFVFDDGGVIHKLPWAECYVGDSESQFRAAAEAWNAYNQAVVNVPEAEQQAVVGRLREQLTRLGALSDGPGSFWGLLLEQAETGML